MAVSRRDFLSALGAITASSIVVPAALAAASRDIVVPKSAGVTSSAFLEMDVMAQYALQQIGKLLPGKFAVCDFAEAKHLMNVSFYSGDEGIDDICELLANECIFRNIGSFAVPPHPEILRRLRLGPKEITIESTAEVTSQSNLSLRLIKIHDHMEEKHIFRIDMAGA